LVRMLSPYCSVTSIASSLYWTRDSLEEARADLRSARSFAKWHPESLDHYIQGAVVPVQSADNVFDPESAFGLACHPHIEASLYSGGTICLTEDEMAGVQCPITFQYGGRSKLFLPEYKQRLVDQYPQRYRMAEPVPNTSHVLNMEDPETCALRIVEALAELPPFQSHDTASARL
jgi:pimeloyl-ACP methyl ester carboxylesterase